jgi:hypothetical protein
MEGVDSWLPGGTDGTEVLALGLYYVCLAVFAVALCKCDVSHVYYRQEY